MQRDGAAELFGQWVSLRGKIRQLVGNGRVNVCPTTKLSQPTVGVTSRCKLSVSLPIIAANDSSRRTQMLCIEYFSMH